MRSTTRTILFLALAAAVACDDGPNDPGRTPGTLTLNGVGQAADRYNAELWVRGNFAYTTSWGSRNGANGNAVKIWDVTGAVPLPVDSVIVANAGTLGDVQVSDDGAHLFVAVEPQPNGALAIYSLADPRRPALVTRFTGAIINRGVHTAEIARVGGTLYAFLCTDPAGTEPGTLVIVSLANPAAPQIVSSSIQGQPYIHDVFVRDGVLFANAWDGGLRIYDIGGGGEGGTPAAPRLLGNVLTVGGNAHNAWWYHDAAGNRKYVFVGEEGPTAGLSSASGDIHVVDVSNFAQPREVAFYSVPNAGTHNFSMDEARGVLYAAYYNGGVRAIDVRGDLALCDASQKTADGRCNLALMGREIASSGTNDPKPQFVWGVQYLNGKVYATDMITGLWKYDAAVP